MTNNQYQQKIQTLNKWANAYCVEDNPVVTDEEYDKLYHEMIAKEKMTI
jgi:DNA ligase (NAD+)